MAASAAKKVLIGGGTGFIGQNLCRLLTSKGCKVINVTRMPGADNISWTKLEASGLPTGVTAVVNCAGQQFMDLTKSWTPGFKQNVRNSRVYTTKALAKAVDKADPEHKPKVFVVITGVGAYEPSRNKIYDEDSPIVATDFFSCLCVDWERAAQVHSSVRTVIIRSGAVIGRFGGMIQRMFLPFYFGVGGKIGTGQQFLPWIHIDDLTNLILFAIQNENVHGILNGVAPQVITNAEFTNAFAKALRRPAFCTVPETVLNLLLNPERAMIMTKGQQVKPKRVLEYGFKYQYEDIEKACKSVAHLFPKLRKE